MLERGRRLSEATLSDLASAASELGVKVELSEGELRQALSPRWAVEACLVEGGPRPEEVERMIAERLKGAEADEAFFSQLKERLREADERLEAAVKLVGLGVEVG
jgi:hypothetical protein